MKKLQQLFAPVVLTLVLSASTFAGDGIIMPWVTPPPPIVTNGASAAEGIIELGVTSSDPVAEIALGVLQSVLALF